MKYYDWTAHHAYSQPHKIAIVDLHTGREFSYAALDERAARIADWLQKKGVAKSDRVAILALNCPEFMELQFACSKIGAIALPVNWRLTVPELERSTGVSRCRSLNTFLITVRQKCWPTMSFSGKLLWN
jgi:fatty-acyl-CoA synthase